MKSKTRYCRKKAAFGESLAAAGITAAATIAGAVMNAAATKKHAKESAAAMEESAKLQAEQIKDQTRENKLSVKEQIAANRELNEQQQQFEKVQQQNMLRQLGINQGNQNRDAALIQARNGGRYSSQFPLRGVNNMQFKVTDGGGVEHIMRTPEGYDLYEIKGDTHKEYHKTKNGKYKSGVGIKFETGKVIEGEGAPKGKDGELLLTTPNDALFISRHSLKGYNPVEDVKQGTPPVEVFNKQEAIKTRYGINSSGKKAEYGLGIGQNIEDNTNFDNIPLDDAELKLKNGGRVRALFGLNYYKNPNNLDERIENNQYGQAVGSLVNAGTNLLAGGINALGSARATRYAINGNKRANEILQDAYRGMKGINPNSVDWSSWRPQHAMAFTREARVNVNPELTSIERGEQRMSDAIRKNTSSGAAKLSRLGTLGVNAGDARSRVFSNQNRMEEQIRQHNADVLTDINKFNAQLESNANMQIGQNKLALQREDAQIRREAAEKAAMTEANTKMQNANLKAQRTSNITSSITSGVLAGAKSISDTLGAIGKQRTDLEIKRLGVTPSVAGMTKVPSDDYGEQLQSITNEELDEIDQTVKDTGRDRREVVAEYIKKRKPQRNGGRYSKYSKMK